MPFPDLTSLPEWARPLFVVVFAIAVAIGSSATWRGITKGRTAPAEQRPRDTQIEMMTLDGSAMREATKAIEAHGKVLSRLADAHERYIIDLNKQREREQDERIEQQGYKRGLEEKARRNRQNPVSRGQS